MSVVFGLILLSLLVAAGFLGAFIWAVRSGQFRDTTTPALRMLGDDPPAVPPVEHRGNKVSTGRHSSYECD
jgi:cbb3-type cytochrome oxidase maturation protein